MKVVLVILAIAVFVIIAFTTVNYQVKNNQATFLPPPIPPKLSLDLSTIPYKNQETTLTFQISACQNEPDCGGTSIMPTKLDVKIILPKDTELINVKLQQIYSDISPNETIQHKIRIRFMEIGNYTIEGVAVEGAGVNWYSPGGPPWDWSKELCISLGETKTEIVDCHPRPLSP